jgi:hypothetical protein
MQSGPYIEKAAERMRLLMRALQSRNYRLFFGGQTLSLIGTWMQQVAMSWLVYRLTGSALLLGVVGSRSQVPSFLLSRGEACCRPVEQASRAALDAVASMPRPRS